MNLKKLATITGAVIMTLTFVGLVFYISILYLPTPQISSPVKVRIPQGASLKEIATVLNGKNVVIDNEKFILGVKLSGYGKTLPSGVFTFLDTRSIFNVIQRMVEDQGSVYRMTIPEGVTMMEIANQLPSELAIDPGAFLRACKDNDFIQELNLTTSTLEGFLYPETYFIYKGEDEKDIIFRMVSQYKKEISDSLRMRARDLGFNEIEFITLASIIEGEALYDSERAMISGVYHNRLKRGMKLQADPTIQYIIKDGPRRLYNRDLVIRSPYNTYMHYGLPPGPVNNPGKKSIIAALYPEDVEYLFFVADGDGHHVFSVTEEEHIRAKQRLSKFRKAIRTQDKKSGEEV